MITIPPSRHRRSDPVPVPVLVHRQVASTAERAAIRNARSMATEVLRMKSIGAYPNDSDIVAWAHSLLSVDEESVPDAAP